MPDKPSELHGIVLKCLPAVKPVEYLSALAKVLDPKSVKSFGQIAGNNYGVFFNTAEECEKAQQSKQILVSNQIVQIHRYDPAIKTVFIKGVPMVSSLEPLKNFLATKGEIKSEFKRLPIKDAPECFAHLLSHTIQVRMLLKKDDKELPPFATIDFGEDVISVKIEHGARKCFTCGDRNHIAKLCPKNKKAFPDMPNTKQQQNTDPETNKDVPESEPTTPIEDDVFDDPADTGQPTDDKTKGRGRLWSETKTSNTSSGTLSSPENSTQRPRLLTKATANDLEASYEEWKNSKAANSFLKSGEIFQILSNARHSPDSIQTEALKFTTSSSNLRKQLISLASVVSDAEIKAFIRHVYDSLPIHLAEPSKANLS